jgi:hypothetical protein
VRKDHGEVSPLSREGLLSVGGLTFYPSHCRAAFACSPIPPPLSRRSLLREAFPYLGGVRDREDNGVATFRRCTRVGQVASLRRWLDGCAAGVRSLRTWPRTFWSKRDSSLRLFSCDDAYDALPGLTLTTRSWFPTTLLLAVAVTARAWAALRTEEATLSRGLLSR